jgi:hypothetical protein
MLKLIHFGKRSFLKLHFKMADYKQGGILTINILKEVKVERLSLKFEG